MDLEERVKPVRPVAGTIMKVRNGPVVLVKSVGMKYAHVVDAATGKNERGVHVSGLVPYVPPPQSQPQGNVAASSKAARPTMAELDAEFSRRQQ